MTERSDIDLVDLEARLKERRVELRHLEEVTEESRRPVELDQSRVGRLTRMEAIGAKSISESLTEGLKGLFKSKKKE